MSDHVIHLLPDAIANQIAAGEVIQRPASVVKELVENAVDAGAKTIKVIIKDAGRTLVQVIDDGCGMSEQDARLAFERHATSKITTADDLFRLHSFGFRGEALASICAVAQVELSTKRQSDELGVKIVNHGSKIISQDIVAMEPGTNFMVWNLFFNITARRNYLKKDSVEQRHIVAEFLRIALVNPQISFTLTNDLPLYILPSGSLRQRVTAVVGKALSNDLLPIEAETSIVKIEGFIGTPKTAKKTQSDQYFFVNGRYMSNGYFKKAVIDAYKNIISPEVQPAFFVYLTVDPKEIDVNVHPQKTEIKFENDAAIWQIIHATVRECLGKSNVAPTIDFDPRQPIEIPPFIKNNPTIPTWTPELADKRESGYNPFEYDQNQPHQERQIYNSSINSATNIVPKEQIFQSSLNVKLPTSPDRFIQLKTRYILTQIATGLMIIDQHRASERIKYEALQKVIKTGISSSQKLVFPEVMSLGTEDGNIIKTLRNDLNRIGLEVDYHNDSGELIITAIPSILETTEARGMIEALLYDYREGQIDIEGGMSQYILKILSMQSAVPYGRVLSGEEMATIYDSLFACSQNSFSPSGKTIFTIIGFDDLDGFF